MKNALIAAALVMTAATAQADVNLGQAVVDDKTAYWWIVDVPKKLMGREVQGAFVKHQDYIARTAGIKYVPGPNDRCDARGFETSIELIHHGKVIDRQTYMVCR
ncbi:MAG: hypothetical protein AB1713_01145 [Pseudomonadota bacterium]|jgi:hypothetical protein